MIDLPLFSKLSSCLERLAFGYGRKTAGCPVLKTLSSLSSVISHPTATAKEIRTAERLLLRALEKTKSLPRYPAKIEHPLQAPGMLELGEKTPDRARMHPAHDRGNVQWLAGKATVHSVDRSVRARYRQTVQGAVVSRGKQSGGRVSVCRPALMH